LREGGVIIPGDEAFCNSPLFPVKKAFPSTDWRMVMDLQGVNSSVIPRAPCVPDPHTLLNQLKPGNAYFTVIDLANAFFVFHYIQTVRGGLDLLWVRNGRIAA
jgi:hypothetical protein